MGITIIRVADLNLAFVKADCQNNYQITKIPSCVYANRRQAKKDFNFARFSGKGRHTLH